jgi:CO/xanthine dehydrogenase FAD-binding subunit
LKKPEKHMLLPKFEFHEPRSLDEACDIMAAHKGSAKVLAGGTDLLVNMKKRILNPEHLVSLARIEELKQVTSHKGTLRIGACQTVAELAEVSEIVTKISALSRGAKCLGSPLIRNLATIGGNIGSARPAADLLPPLMAYNAVVTLQSRNGERQMPLEEVITGPGMTAMKPDEIITRIDIPVGGPNTGAGYINIGIRKAQDCNLVNVASFLSLAGDGTVASARIVMGCVGPTPLRAKTAETMLMGEKPGPELFKKAGDAAASDSRPILDFRGSAEYRHAMSGVLAMRTLTMALKEIQS